MLRSTMLTTSLDAMASGGIYDHIGGGFARYSVDAQWLVPHFEKMLYDQALFVRVYTHAAVVTGLARYRQVVEETVEYVLRDLRHPDGGFYCAEDADSPDEHGHGHEGLFHTWTIDEVRGVLGADADAALEWYEFTDGGNFEGRTIPARLHHRGELARPAHIEAARQALFEARNTRLRPGLDDKVLTEWNGLMLASLCEAAAAFDRADWTAAAVANGEFLLRSLRRADGRWHRSWHANGEPQARHDALAGDHAALIDAFTRLGRTHRPGALDRRRARSRRGAARSLLGCRPWWRVHDARRRRAIGGAPEGAVRQRNSVGQLDSGAGVVPIGSADRRGALYPTWRSDPASARPRYPASTERLLAGDHGCVAATRGDHRDRRHRRSPRSGGRSAKALAAERRARLG